MFWTAFQDPAGWLDVFSALEKALPTQFETAPAALDALSARLETGLPGALLLDEGWAREDWQPITALRSRFPGLPIYLLTRHESQRFAIQALQAGCTDCFQPHEVDLLVRALSLSLPGGRAEASLRAPHLPPPWVAMLDQLPVGVWILDPQANVVFANQAARQIWAGVEYVSFEDYHTYKAWWLDTGKPVQPEEWSGYRASKYGESAHDEELEIECFDGAHKIILHSAEPLIGPFGEPLGAIITEQDITARGLAEQALAQAESQFRRLVENSSDLIVEVSEQGKITYLSPVAEAILGYRPGAYSDADLTAYLHPDDVLPINQAVAQAFEAPGRRVKLTHRIRRQDGAWAWFDSSVVFHKPVDTPGRLIVNCRDITAEKQAAEALADVNRRVNIIAENIRDILYVLPLRDPQAGYINPAAARYWGIDVERTGKNLNDLLQMADSQPELMDQALAQIARGEPLDLTYRFTRSDGEPRWAHNRAFPVEDGGVVQYYVGIIEDITAQVELERMLRRDNRLLEQQVQARTHDLDQELLRSADLANLSARIAHETDPDTVLRVVAEETARIVEAPVVTIRLVNPRTQMLEHAYGYGLKPLDARQLAPIPLENLPNLLGQDHQTTVLSGAGLRPMIRSAEFDQARAVRRMLIMPLIYQDTLLGTLNVFDLAGLGSVPEQAETYLRTIANYASVALAKARLFAFKRRRANELEAISTISSSLRGAETVAEMLPILLHSTREVMHADCAAIFLVGGEESRLAAVDGRNPFPENCTIGREEHGRFEKENISPRIIHLQPGSESAPRQVVSGVPGIDTFAAVTICHLEAANQIIGTLVVGYDEEVALSPDENNILVAIAEMAGNALNRARLMETLEHLVRDRTHELTTLYNVTTVLTQDDDLEQAFATCLGMVLQAVGCTMGAIHAVEAEGAPPGFRRLVSQETPEWALRCLESGSSAGCCDALADNPLQEAVAASAPLVRIWSPAPDCCEEPFPSYLIVSPMRTQNKVWGTLTIFREATQTLSPELVTLLVAVADQLASAMETSALRQQKRLQAVDAERQRLARELHDSVTQTIYSLSLFASAGRYVTETGQTEKIHAYFDRIGANAVQALKEMRLLIYELHPPALDEEGLEGAIRRRLETVESRAHVKTSFRMEGALDVPADVSQELYRIVQETLNNILKHAHASKVDIVLRSELERISLEIVDNGVGFDLQQASEAGGVGLRNLRERAKQLGAALEIESTPGGGTRIHVEIER